MAGVICPGVEVALVGEDGNAFHILGIVRTERASARTGAPRARLSCGDESAMMSGMADDPATPGGKGSWWQTLPGMLTGAAGLIAAITAMIVALSGVLGGSDEPQSAAPVTPDIEAALGAGARQLPGATLTTVTTTAAQPSALYDVTFPGGNRATASKQVYEFRSGSTEPRNPGELTLAIAVRTTNHGDYDAGFSDSFFRLGVGDQRLAPVSDLLNEVVAADTSQDAVLEFVVPDAPGTYTLYVKYGDKVEVPVRVARR